MKTYVCSDSNTKEEGGKSKPQTFRNPKVLKQRRQNIFISIKKFTCTSWIPLHTLNWPRCSAPFEARTAFPDGNPVPFGSAQLPESMVLPRKHFPEETFYHWVSAQDIARAEPTMGMPWRPVIQVRLQWLSTAPVSPQRSLLYSNLLYFITNKNHLQGSEYHWLMLLSPWPLCFFSTTSKAPQCSHLEVNMTSLNMNKLQPSHEEHIQHGCWVTHNTSPH